MPVPPGVLRASRRIAAALPMALLLTLVSWIPGARGASFPDTAAERVALRAVDLAGTSRGLTRSADGTVRASGGPATTQEVTTCASMWTTGFGLTWTQSGEGEVLATVRAGAGQDDLGRAFELEAEEADHTPDPGTPEYRPQRRATPFWWTGGGRCARVSLRIPAGVSVRAVETVFLNTSGTAEGPGGASSLASAAGGLVRGLLGGAPAAEASPAHPRWVYRSQWGADDSLNNCDPYYAPELKMAFVHHTAGSNDYSADESDDILRGIQYFHTQVQGWCDIAYNFLVDRFGTVFIGRKGGAAKPTVPGATQGFNTGSTAVSAMGNYDTVPVPSVVQSAIERLLAWRLDVAHLPPDGWATMTSQGGDNNKYPAGTNVTMRLISGHRRTGYTACPGDNLNALLDQIRGTVTNLGLPKIWRPGTSTDQITPGFDDGVTVTATGSTSLSWQVDVLDATGLSVKTIRASGEALTVVWKGKQQDWSYAPAGEYRIVVAATDGSGAGARQASFPLTVNVTPAS